MIFKIPVINSLCCFVVILDALLLPILAHAQTDPATPPEDINALFGQPFPDVKIGPNKTNYTAVNPTPDDQMRAFSTDRPGKTHSSTTVDAGHFQVESDFVNYTYDRNSPRDQTTHNYSVTTPIVKWGVTNWADIEAAFALFNASQVLNRATGVTTSGQGFGDISLGSKINIFGNDDGRQSFALLPFVKVPMAAKNVGNGVTEFTLNAPYTYNLDSLWSVTAEPAFGALKNNDNNGLHGDYSFLFNLNRPLIVKPLIAAIEFASEYSSDRQATPRYTFDPSLQYLIAKALQLDIGAYIGLNKAAPDFFPYTGISFRY